ncbi:hypothetical protein ACHQM5_000846 [Ranunculus cassubicifolius]
MHVLKPDSFAELDEDGNRALDCLRNFKALWCDNCREILKNSYFTCRQCFFQEESYDLCIDCYGRKASVHEHEVFVDNHALLSTLQKMDLEDQLGPDEGNRNASLILRETGVKSGLYDGNPRNTSILCEGNMQELSSTNRNVGIMDISSTKNMKTLIDRIQKQDRLRTAYRVADCVLNIGMCNIM